MSIMQSCNKKLRIKSKFNEVNMLLLKQQKTNIELNENVKQSEGWKRHDR